MADLVSIFQVIIDLALKIKKQVETFRHNREDCRKMGELVDTVRAVAESLRKNLLEEEEEDGGALVGRALYALKQSLVRAWGVVAACQRKNAVLRALEADAIADKLRRVRIEVSMNLSAVLLATSAYNTSQLADINGNVAALGADVAEIREDVAEIRERVDALPDALRQEVETLVQRYQNESTRDTKKTETKKTQDAARYDTYSYDGYPGGQRQYNVPYDQQRYSAGRGATTQAFSANVQPVRRLQSYDDYQTQINHGYRGAQGQYSVPCDQQHYDGVGSGWGQRYGGGGYDGGVYDYEATEYAGDDIIFSLASGGGRGVYDYKATEYAGDDFIFSLARGGGRRVYAGDDIIFSLAKGGGR